MTSLDKWISSADAYVLGHIYSLEANTVNQLFEEYQRAYANMSIALEATMKRYGGGETWSASDAQYRQRTESLLSQMIAEMRVLTSSTANTTLTAAQEAWYASYFGKAWISDVASNGTIRAPLLPVEAVRAAIMAPYQGSTFIDRWRGKDEEFALRIRKSIVQSQINGETIYQAQKRIAAELGLDISRRRAADKLAHKADFNRVQMISRTEILRSSNMGALALYQANEDILDGHEVQTAKDDRVCPICAPEDGKVYPLNSTKLPPFHPNCRCDTIPHFKDERANKLVRGDVPTFTEWARSKGISSNLYGQVYQLRAQKPPKSPKGA